MTNDEPRDRNDGKPESEFNMGPVFLRFVLVVNHLAMWIYGQQRRSLPKTRVSHCDLRVICTMPLDVLYEVRFLTPISTSIRH